MTLGERIKKVRKALDLTQQVFADKIGMKRNSIAQVESGRNTSDQTIIAICREFDVSEEWLRTGEGEMFTPSPSNALDALAKEYNLSQASYILIQRFLSLKPEAQQVFVDYAVDVAEDFAARKTPSSLTKEPSVPDFSAKHTPINDEAPASQRIIWEQEADAFAAMAREQFLSEKLRESQILSAKESDAG